ncbi:class II aldolase/adducin family protein, partial [Streptomyces griseolus]|uniref:class II aldolase/adducin family protein n=1 Tax=Streptomyces griseolus TaxID=1909 RepID=UPI0022435DE3
ADLAAIDPDGLSELGLDGVHLAGPRPSKEFPLHSAFYRRDATTRAVVHLHARHATAVSCLPPWSPRSAVPPLTPYYVMRVGQTPLLPYAPPGDAGQAEDMARLPFPFRAVDAAVELEEVAALLLSLGERPARLLTPEEAGQLARTYDSPWDDHR